MKDFAAFYLAKIARVEAENKDLVKFQNTLALAQLALPATDGIPNFLRSLQSLGIAGNRRIIHCRLRLSERSLDLRDAGFNRFVLAGFEV